MNFPGSLRVTDRASSCLSSAGLTAKLNTAARFPSIQHARCATSASADRDFSLAATLQAPRLAEPLSIVASPSSRSEDGPAKSPQDWLKAIAPEIVRNVHEAPVMHLLFENHQSEQGVSCERRQVGEEDVNNPDNWPAIRSSLLGADPDAVVLVHKLDEDDLSRRYGEAVEGDLPAESRSSFGEFTPNNTWGLVILGKKSKRHACYILQTTRVFSVAGAATHFSFTKAKCFGPSLHQQLEQGWLA